MYMSSEQFIKVGSQNGPHLRARFGENWHQEWPARAILKGFSEKSSE